MESSQTRSQQGPQGPAVVGDPPSEMDAPGKAAAKPGRDASSKKRSLTVVTAEVAADSQPNGRSPPHTAEAAAAGSPDTPGQVDIAAVDARGAAAEAPPSRLLVAAIPPERLFLALAIGLTFAYLGIERLLNDWHWMSDLHYFYDAANLIFSDHRDILYNPQARVDAGFAEKPGHETFPYPASLAPLYLPFTLTDQESARHLFLGVEIGFMLLLVGLAYRWSRDAWFAGFLALAMLSCFTLYEALRFHQLAPILAVVLCLALLNLTGGRGRSGAFLIGLLAFKPSLALLPLAFMAWQRDRRLAAIAAVTAGTIALVAPLMLVGSAGLSNYFEQLWRYREEAFVLDGQFTAGAAWMLNWQGFLGKLTSAAPDKTLVALLDVATLAVMLKVWLRRDVYYGLLAAVIATLLVMPHAVWYDWLILLGVAPFVVYRYRSPSLIALLVLLHFATSLDSYVIVTSAATSGFLFTTPLIGMAILVHIAFSATPQAKTAPTTSEPAEPPTVQPLPTPVAT